MTLKLRNNLNTSVLMDDLDHIHKNVNKKFFFNKTIFITGYMGFVGFELSKYFIHLKIESKIVIFNFYFNLYLIINYLFYEPFILMVLNLKLFIYLINNLDFFYLFFTLILLF
jgi:hypothetical protein